ncbi:MAG: HAD family phosphatase [Verrucomicrobia bacterium]|jgi:HAD superfamily hydrolase (TIGR01509 family)|nr:HAD family phosphatase [Verrucomicrobiota bacterium]
MLRAFFFDFDGLILDTETPLIDAYAAVHAVHGVPFDRSLFLHGVGHADYSFDPWHGFSPHADRADLELQRRAAKEKIILGLPPLPGVLALLDAAREEGLRTAVVSNSPHSWVDGHLARLGLIDRFEFIACREDAASPKPEPDLYRLALNHFGLRGHEGVAFEDSHTGSLAARRANLWTVVAPNESTAHHDLSNAHWLVRSLADVDLPALRARFEAA